MQIERFAPCPLWVVGGHLSAFLWVRFPHTQTSVGVTITPAQCRSATTYPSTNARQAKQRSPGGCPRGFRAGPTILAGRGTEETARFLGYFGRKPSQASSVHELLILAQITFDRLT